MGLCGSSLSPEQKMSKSLDAQAEADFAADRRKIKLLLLGAGESGKSTIFKQMKILYGVGFQPDDLKATVPVIHSNVIGSMQALCTATDTLGIPVASADEKAYILTLDPDEDPCEGKTAEAIKTLWTDDGIQSAYEQRSKFQLNDSAKYYFEKLDVISAPGYVASIEDLLKSRVRTSGIVEECYKIEDTDFVMYDVGGQRNERKKWIHCFDDVTAIIFVASASEYDQSLFEDASVNRMEEAVTLFADIANSRWFKNSAVILFLNKRDLFEQKIKKVDIKSEGAADTPDRFLDYPHGMCTCEEADTTGCAEKGCGVQPKARDYILSLFQKQYTSGPQLYHHVTCATDTGNVEHVFNACREVILEQNMAGSGFMS